MQKRHCRKNEKTKQERLAPLLFLYSCAEQPVSVENGGGDTPPPQKVYYIRGSMPRTGWPFSDRKA